MQLANQLDIETRYGLRTFELYEGDLSALSQDVDVLALSAFSGHYTPSQGTVIGALYRNLGVSIKQMAMECEYDLRNAFSIWISSPMSGFKFKRILCVEIIGSQFQLADVLENLFVGMAILEAKGVEISSLALPILGAGRERLDPKTVMRILLPAAQRALERSLHLSRILFVELKPEHVATLRDTMDEVLHRAQAPLPQDQPVKSPHVETNIFRKTGEFWNITYQRHPNFFLRHLKGLEYIAFLLHHSNEEYTPLELLQRVGEHVSLVNEGTSEAGEIVDEQTNKECQKKWHDLKEQKAEAEQNQDYELVARLQAEIEAIANYLTNSTHGRKSKQFPTEAEKARSKVTHRISDAIEKIRTHHDALAQHLRVCIKTGASCSYKPAPHNSISWFP